MNPKTNGEKLQDVDLGVCRMGDSKIRTGGAKENLKT